jgi:penicillin-binding protein 1A
MDVASKQSWWWRMLGKAVVLAVLLVAIAVGAMAAHLAVLRNQLPDLSAMSNYQPLRSSRVFDRSGNLVASFYDERRTVVPVERIPAHVKQAFLAAEDEDFYQHAGIDYFAIARCALNRVRGGVTCGGSTITQQTAKTFLLNNERTLDRKLKEMLLTKEVEQRFSKDEILHLYLNQIYFGNGAYGIEEAARTYYGVGVDKVTIAQAAVLASIPKSPSRINPWADPKRVRQRRGYVLGQMVANSFISKEQADAANLEPVRTDVAPPEFLDIAPGFAEAVRQQLTDGAPGEDINRAGLTAYTTLDAKLQRAANAAVDDGLRALDKRQGYRGPLLRLDPDDAKRWLDAVNDERARRFPLEETPQLNDALAEGRPIWDFSAVTKTDAVRQLHTGDVHDDDQEDTTKPITGPAPIRSVRTRKLLLGDVVGGVVKQADNAARGAVIDLGTTQAWLPFAQAQWARSFSPVSATEKPKAIADVLRAGDVVLVKIDRIAANKGTPQRVEVSLEQEPLAQASLVAIDPHSHQVVAMVGGFGHARGGLNRATQAFRQAGSAFKPFIYATALDSKKFSPVGFVDTTAEGTRHRLLTDAPKVFFDRWTQQRWQPQNSGGRFLGDLTLRQCLTHSVNTCSITLVETLGVDAILDVAKRAGLANAQRPFPANLTLALGTGEVRPLDLVHGYTAFVNNGVLAPLTFIDKAKRADGTTVALPAAAPSSRLFSPQTAYLATDMMRSVVDSGTAQRARELGRPVAGKTGTTNEARSVWFVGYTPDLVVGVYVGFDDNAPLGKQESGGRAAVPIWLQFMKTATAGMPVHDFPVPDGIVRRAVDASSGLLSPAGEALAPGELPPPIASDNDDDPIPATLPTGVIAEAFVAGTEPTQTSDDAPPAPLDVRDQGGLAP